MRIYALVGACRSSFINETFDELFRKLWLGICQFKLTGLIQYVHRIISLGHHQETIHGLYEHKVSKFRNQLH